ncbi:MAG: alpha-ketoacid dehydrogenase subunit beta [Anaerolineales bacterium]|nr:alpha-ketoacid dehydrogenase subunit beta [Anaerolineales bacterium]MCS7248164.1 alpha-ketoacid dehydrogenase subunit beta [Anaerolineales bacterium]MDW8161976.1 alpha-ketoacid dehydrogenase subunit beta [Anaerolineales bacterium]MDW8445811.1 alpha-ketoacid dehydrogenase subunit beta [Anaerolineales bacterium]
MREITYSEAIREAMSEEMRRDPRVFLMGEDVGVFGGVWGVSAGMLQEFGEERVRDTAISETAIVGMGLGAALCGMRPIVEIMFADFLMCAGDQIVNQVAKARYMSGGKADVPLVIRVTTGAPGSAAAQHSQSAESWFMNVPGLKIAVPATPADAKGLLKTALRGRDPVLFFEHKMLYALRGPVPEDENFTVPFGEAAIRRSGDDLTIIAIGGMVPKALQAAEKLAQEGIQAEVIDPRTLVPLDVPTLLESVAKTGRVMIVHEAHRRSGPGAEIAAILAEQAVEYLDAPILRVAAKNVPIPYSPSLEQTVLPQEEDILRAAHELMRGVKVAEPL